MLKYLSAALLFVTPLAAELSQNEIKTKMIRDLEVIQQTFEVNYAPKDWKKSFTNWDLTEQIEKAKIKILEKKKITVKDYQYIIRDFFRATKDYHVGVEFFSTEVSVLPFRMISTQGKYFIAWAMENDWYPYMDYSLSVGDEILEYNGRQIDEVIKEFMNAEFGNPDSLTDQALAEASFTVRTALRGNTIPLGEVRLTVRKANTSNIEKYVLQWMYMPEKISDHFASKAKKPKKTYSENQPKGEHPYFHKEMVTPAYYQQKSSVTLSVKALKAEEASGFEYLGLKKSFIPTLGKVLWSADSQGSIDAYIYQTPAKKKVGYFRVPHYMLGEQEIGELSKIISVFQKKTDALVIDQLNNPGGNMFFMYALVSMLSDQPMVVPKQQMMITSSDVYFAHEMLSELKEVSTDEEAAQMIGKSIAGYPVNLAFINSLNKHFSFIVQEWDEGRMFTQSDYLYGVDFIPPYPKVQYTKPIIVLVNSLDFSCGDFFPAILQDNKRAKIIGTQTAGAGGYVLGHEFSNLFGIASFRFTGSIAERINLQPIENLGVAPDVVIGMTERDLECNYVDYMKAVNDAVDAL